jgi:nucleoid-associated protein YgaU
MLAVRLGSVLAAFIALAAVPGAAAEPGRWNMGATKRFAQGASRGPGSSFVRLAQAQGRKPDAASEEQTDNAPPLTWLRHSSERFRTLMRMLATRSSRSGAQRAAAIKAAEEEAKRAAEAKAAEEAKQAKAAEEAKRAAEEAKRAAEEAKRATEAKAAEEAKQAKAVQEAERAAEEAKRAAEAKAAEEAKQAEAVEEAERTVKTKAAEEAKRAAEAKAAEEAKQAKATEEARRAAEATREAEAKRLADAKPAKRLAPCRNAGVKVAGGGWYVVQVGDSLWSISRAHYGYGRAYRRIHAANWRRIASPSRIYPCQRLYIPRSRLGEGPLQHLRAALAPFLRRRAGDGDQPGLDD